MAENNLQPPKKKRGRKIILIFCLIISPCLIGALWYFYFGPGSGPKAKTYMVTMRDGINLATDVYLPEGDGPFPIILYRTPYNKDSDPGPLYVMQYNVGVVTQDHRGCYASEGDYTGFGSDGTDAYDTVEWLKTQPWFNGKYATMGGSARGITQYMQVPYLEDVCCQYIEVGTSDLISIAMFQGGAPRKMLAENWLAGINQADYYFNLFDHINGTGEFAEDHRVDEWEWGNVTWPAIHRGGWFDCFGQGTIDGFMGYQFKGGDGGRGQSKLIMGPWTHDLGNNKPGHMIFPLNAKSDPWSSKIFEAMYAESLLGLTQYGNYRTMPNVTYYVMGDLSTNSTSWNRWATAETWPLPYTNRSLYFQPNGTMATTPATTNRNYTYLYDPRLPIATAGGANLNPNNRGPFVQNNVETGKTDLLQFEYAVTEPLLVTGRISVHLFVVSNCTDTDFTAKLMDVYPNGTSYILNDGIVRMRFRDGLNHEKFMDGSNQTVYDAWIDLWSTSYVFNTGHTIRVSISSSNYPRFDVNPNTGLAIKPVNASTTVNIAQNSLVISNIYPSRIILPVPTSSPNFVT